MSRGGKEHVGAVQVVWVILRVAWGIEPGVMSFNSSFFSIFWRVFFSNGVSFEFGVKAVFGNFVKK